MSGGISSNYNSGGNIYTTGWRGAGSAGSAGSADSMSSAGSAGSYGSTATGSANGSFGNWGSVFCDEYGIERPSYYVEGYGVCGSVGMFHIDHFDVYVRDEEFGRDDVLDEPLYWPQDDGSGTVQGMPPFTNKGFMESISD